MEISFTTPRLRDICERRADAIDALDPDGAFELAARLADIDAMAHAGELEGIFGNDVSTRPGNVLALRLATGHVVVLASGHARQRLRRDGTVDWQKVTRVRVVDIEMSNE